MNFKDLLLEKNVTGYALAKTTNIPYTTISDLINGKTSIQNVSLKHAISISKYLKVNVETLAKLESPKLVDFRYFRNNVLSALKREGSQRFIQQVIKKKEIDYYYKNNGKEYAFYLLALIDYLCRINKNPIYDIRYNELRKEKLKKPFFVGSDLISFTSIDDAEKKLGIVVIDEFKRFNLIEGDVFNVA